MDAILYLLLKFKYLILFPLAIVEGPVLAIIAGFICTEGYLNIFIVYPVIVLGDVVGDSIVYMVGRWGVPVFLKKILKHFGMKTENIEKARGYFDANSQKAISLSKITLGIGIAGIYFAGNARIPYSRFLKICLVTSALQYVVYLGIGLLFGSAYQQISHYLNFFAAFLIVTFLSVISFYVIKSICRKL